MKKIFAGILAVVLCLCLCACGDKQEYLENIMDYERTKLITTDNDPYTPDRLREIFLEDPYGYVIKITVTKKYDNVLIYEEEADTLGELKGVAGVEKLPKTIYGDPISERIDVFRSYILTTVNVDEIYYRGENVEFSDGQSIKLVENCCITAKNSDWKLLQDDDDEKVLNALTETDWYKLEPGKEYIIFGYKATTGIQKGTYQFLAHNATRFEPDKTRPADYYDSENAQQVIDDVLTEYEQRIRENYSYVLK